MGRLKLVFFSMPFGRKLVGEDVHDFDETWHMLLQPAVPEGWEHKRIDEVDEGGPIPEQFKHFLRTADVVVFDLTSANPNVLYELGIRDVFAPGRRVLVAREGTTLPFNIAAERVIHYPADVRTAIDSGFLQRVKEQILAAVGGGAAGLRTAPTDQRLRAQVERATTLPSLVALWEEWKTFVSVPVDPLLLMARAFSEHRRLDLAVDVARYAYHEEPNQWEVARILGWYLRRTDALDEAGELLVQALALNPRDIESMGMLGGMYKRKAITCLREDRRDEAREWFERSREMYLRASGVDARDVYSLVNVGALTFVAGDRENAAYRQIVDIVGKDSRVASTWDLLVLGEAHLVLGNRESALNALSSAALRKDFSVEMQDSMFDQLALLEAFGLPSAIVGDARAIMVGERTRPGKAVVLIHLSDVHFGKKPSGSANADMHRFRPRPGLHDHRSLAEHIIEECAQEVQNGVAVFVVISGDAVYQATRDEYDQASLFVRTLMTGLKLNTDRLVIVPGNHDVNWKLSDLDAAQRFDEFLIFARRLFEERFEAVYPFVHWDFSIDSARPLSHEILSVHKIPEHGLAIIGFNSCVLEDHQRHFGAIGKEQVKLAAKAVEEIDPSWLRLAVMHHHVLPLESKLSTGEDGAAMDGTIVRDYGLVERELHKLGFDVVLHGHKHEPGVRISRLVNAFGPEGGKSLIICGAGSAGVEKAELPDDWGNHFAIYRIPEGRRRPGAVFLEVEWRELPYNDIHRRWLPRGRWQVEG